MKRDRNREREREREENRYNKMGFVLPRRERDQQEVVREDFLEEEKAGIE